MAKVVKSNNKLQCNNFIPVPSFRVFLKYPFRYKIISPLAISENSFSLIESRLLAVREKAMVSLCRPDIDRDCKVVFGLKIYFRGI